MKTAEILDLAKLRANIPSDYALSQKLECTRSAVSLWRLAKSFPDNLFCTKLADMCGLEAMQVISWVEIERAEKAHATEDVSYWRRYAQRGAATAATLVLGTLLSAPAPSHSQVNAPSDLPLYTL